AARRVVRNDRKAGVRHRHGVRDPRVGAAIVPPVGRRSRHRLYGRPRPIELTFATVRRTRRREGPPPAGGCRAPGRGAEATLNPPILVRPLVSKATTRMSPAGIPFALTVTEPVTDTRDATLIVRGSRTAGGLGLGRWVP